MRSRADLRRINSFMGNERWIVSAIPANTRHITEIGAGEGTLIANLFLHRILLAEHRRHLPGRDSAHAINQWHTKSSPASGCGQIL